MNKAELFIDCKNKLGEGITWDDEHQILYWLDIPMPSKLYKHSLENNSRPNQICINLKYFRGLPVIKDIRCVSRPGKRIYKSVKEISNYNHISSTYIISTVKGILSDREALLQNVGGEVLCKIN